ncbi:hypothetical protein GCM10009799_33080 [Nocardiopsis rhodophaea]|uniref:Uncharacterized protein n=1 Tax=Nocardiopsis rhodophaea TaxID=280238 RepID=A0ABN2TAH1_9ACTN
MPALPSSLSAAPAPGGIHDLVVRLADIADPRSERGRPGVCALAKGDAATRLPPALARPSHWQPFPAEGWGGRRRA